MVTFSAPTLSGLQCAVPAAVATGDSALVFVEKGTFLFEPYVSVRSWCGMSDLQGGDLPSRL